MALLERQSMEISSLVVESGRSDPIVIQVIGLLGDHDIVTPEDLIAAPIATLDSILPDQPRTPYSQLTLGRALKAVAEVNRDIELQA